MRKIMLFGLAMAIITSANAVNTPCSGKKGGISRCENGRFVCQDGSMSASKRVCDRNTSGAGAGAAMANATAEQTPEQAARESIRKTAQAHSRDTASKPAGMKKQADHMKESAQHDLHQAKQSAKTAGTATSSAACDCRSGNLCTGHRGGQYCVTPSGQKRYQSKEH